MTNWPEKGSTPEYIKPKAGVVVFISNPEGKLFIIREKDNKEETGKVAGKIGVVCETFKEEVNKEQKEKVNEPVWGAVLRAIEEETGVNWSNFNKFFDITTLRHLGLQEFVPNVSAYVFSVTCKNPDGLFQSCLKKGDRVTPVGWLKREDLLEATNLRAGVRNILNAKADTY